MTKRLENGSSLYLRAGVKFPIHGKYPLNTLEWGYIESLGNLADILPPSVCVIFRFQQINAAEP